MAKVYQMTVIGTPLECGEPGCSEAATVLLRHADEDKDRDDQMLYCDACWLATRRAYAPLVAHDTQLAMREAQEAIRSHGNGV